MFRELSKSPDSVDQLVQTLRTIADPTRLRLLGVLQGGERNVSSLCEELSLPQPTVSHHLGLLRNAALVTNRREGKQVFYGLNEKVIRNGSADGSVHLQADVLEMHLLSRVPDPSATGAAPTTRPGVSAMSPSGNHHAASPDRLDGTSGNHHGPASLSGSGRGWQA